MKICFVSDLHVDIGQQPDIVWPEADVLCVAGDTANSGAGLLRFLSEVQGRYENVMVVDGNHEHYINGTLEVTVDENNEQLNNICNTLGATFLPAHGAVKVGSKYFIGRNAWYSFDYAGDPEHNKIIWPDTIQDNRFIGFDKIAQMPPWHLAEKHADEIDGIIDGLYEDDADPRIVVMTHVAPHRDLIASAPQFIRSNAFFCNTHLTRVLEKHGEHIDVWQYGHTHFRTTKSVDDVYCLANPRGYPTENPSWEPVVLDL